MQISKGSGKSGGATWSSRFGFLMASVGFAVGLGNIWRFPYVTGENGGGAFILVYLCCVFLIGIPILMAEVLLGRRGSGSPPIAMENMAKAEGRGPAWAWVGRLTLATAFLIEVVYCVIAGWVLYYLYQAITVGFTGVDAASSQAAFEVLATSTSSMLLWTGLGLLITGGIIYFGVQNGIERAVKVLMPTLFILLLGLAVYNMQIEGFPKAVNYLLSVDFSKISADVWLVAVGQAFFSMGVAMAGMMVFGSYLPRDVSIGKSVVLIAGADTMVALLAGFVIFPLVFNFGLDPAGGPGLIFQTMPVAFAQMPGGQMLSILFFLLLSVAAITSMVGLVEPLCAWLQGEYNVKRHRATAVIIIAVGLVSVLSILSFADSSFLSIAGTSLNDAQDVLTNKIMLPLGGLLIAIFAGWFVAPGSLRDELQISSPLLYNIWYFLIRFVVPAAVVLIMLSGVTE
jgi:NSS family neurotransmitter:Na+ symporter